MTLLALLLVAGSIGAENPQWEELFFRANEAYQEARFQEAVDGYSQLIRSGHESGHLFYNLGNAYFRLNELGWAILNYERARLLIPRDADLNFNVRYARDQMQDAVAETQGLMNTTFFWLDTFNLYELFWGFAVLNVVFWAILVTRLFVRPDWIFYPLLIVLIVWFIAGLSFGLKWYQVYTDERAVIVQEEISVLAGPDINDTVLFKLHAGTEVCHERSEDGWSLVSLPDKKRGWVKKEAIEPIKRAHSPLLAAQATGNALAFADESSFGMRRHGGMAIL
jgi:tetratricopeptide (TPR) repeat protein